MQITWQPTGREIEKPSVEDILLASKILFNVRSNRLTSDRQTRSRCHRWRHDKKGETHTLMPLKNFWRESREDERDVDSTELEMTVIWCNSKVIRLSQQVKYEWIRRTEEGSQQTRDTTTQGWQISPTILLRQWRRSRRTWKNDVTMLERKK